MRLTKDDFSFHRLIGNKYYEQTYLAYLGRGNKKFRYEYSYKGFNVHNPNPNAIPVKLYIIITYDFVIRCNNIIRRRGTIESNMEELRELFNNKFYISNENWMAWCPKTTIDKYYREDEIIENPTQEKFHNILYELGQWKNKFETNYEEFKQFIHDLILDFDSNHYSWIVGENIVYNRSIKDNADKKYFCCLSTEKGIDRFKEIYLKNIYLETDKDLLIEQISDILVTLVDVYNLIISKKYDEALEFLTDFLEENENIKLCKDIYYSKIFVDMHDIIKMLNDKEYQKALLFIKQIINSENKKYANDKFALIENISIVENEIEFGQYFEL